ncbi:MAG: hypothetical protein ACRCZF_00395 [Gemmataceae bacterium]
MRSRYWLLLPAVVLFAADVGLTLTGQPPAYWAGDFSTAIEANPIAYPILANSPWLFIGLATLWLILVSIIVVRWNHVLSGWMAVFVAFAHAIGGASWLVKLGPWGLFAAIVYIAGAAQLANWCWRSVPSTERSDSDAVQ